MCVNSCHCHHKFFKLPLKFNNLDESFQRQLKYLTSYVHGLKWENGEEEEYTNLSTILLSFGIDKDSQIIVKGLQKKVWLEKLLPHFSISNIEDSGCPSLSILKNGSNKYHCSKHAINNLLCAHQNTHLIKNWMLLRHETV